MTTTEATLTFDPASAPDLELRQSFRRYVLAEAEPWYKERLTFLYEMWDRFNTDFFRGELKTPYLVLGTPGLAKALATHNHISNWGGTTQLTFRLGLFDGERYLLQDEAHEEGRKRYWADVLLHEMVHQFHNEVTLERERSYKGHGPHFADTCNEIGSDLGLDEVRPAKARGKEKEKPSCAYWPLNVRPADYYQGAVVIKEPKTSEGDTASVEDETDPQAILTDQEIDSLMDVVQNWFQLTGDAVPMNALGKLFSAAGVGN